MMKKLWIFVFLMIITFPIWGTRHDADAKSIAIDDKNFPDFYFQTYVKKKFDTNKDGKLSDKERKAVTEIDVGRPSEYRLDWEYPAPDTLEGIEFFPNLKRLFCAESYLGVLDVSKNIKLEELNCRFNNLEELNLKYNKYLRILSCGNNNLKKIDVGKNAKLEKFYCNNNKLKQINLDKNKKLTALLVSYNKLQKLNIKGLSQLQILCCSKNKLKKLDLTHNKKLNTLECDTNKLTKLNVSKNKLLDYLHVGNNAIRKLDLSKNKLLQTFCCNDNQLLTGNVKLSQTQLERCEASTQKATLKIKKIGKYYYLPLPNVLGTNVISNLSYGKLTSKGIRVKKSTLPKTITYEYNMFTDGEEKTKVTIRTKK